MQHREVYTIYAYAYIRRGDINFFKKLYWLLGSYQYLISLTETFAVGMNTIKSIADFFLTKKKKKSKI